MSDGPSGDKQLAEFLDRRINPVQDKIVDTPPRTIAGVVAKLRMMVYFDEKLGSVVPDNLVASALAGAEYVMRGPGVVVGSAVAAPDLPRRPVVRVGRVAENRNSRRSHRPQCGDCFL